ncbi:MAG TPA: C-type lectin domain-containing protein [Polyangia bacterium]|nr:C-type lectin domain-containing protein [Polyangia bacterium]
MVGILFATTAACGGAETFHAKPDSGGLPSGPGIGGASGGGGDDAGGGAAGSGGDDGGDDRSGGSGGTAGEDAPVDIPAGAGGSAGSGGQGGGSGGSGGSDAGRDLPGGSGGSDAGRDVPVETVPPACTSTPDCPCFQYGAHAYRFCKAGRTHSAAQSNCVAQQMRLVRVDSDAENKWLYSTKIAQNFMTTWLGGSDAMTEGDWRWADNTPFWTGRGLANGGMPVNNLYNAWEVGAAEPNQTGDEDCAAFWYQHDRWADLTCTDLNAYICESY